ncbi:hypothetical protein GGQ68_000938 [Sagittula marina]|uniref:Uncharacterized protein n=1 Tax=Sagittula marina TaxID=943940 RepID=A0A7W6DKU4_9RHOB|nr:hypothetical protein [Sagittula marina]
MNRATLFQGGPFYVVHDGYGLLPVASAGVALTSSGEGARTLGTKVQGSVP